jgi:hypothetical protein
MKIEIKSSDVGVKSGTSKRTGKAYTIREQVGSRFLFGGVMSFVPLACGLWFCADCGGEMQYEGIGCWWCVDCGQSASDTMDMLVREEARQQFDSEGYCVLASREDLDGETEDCDEWDGEDE